MDHAMMWAARPRTRRILCLLIGLIQAVLATDPGLTSRRCSAQAMLADDVIILSKGQAVRKAAMEKGKGGDARSLFPGSPGSGGSRLPSRPTPLGPILGSAPESMGVLSAASGYTTAFSGRSSAPGIAPLPPTMTPAVPQFGHLELPAPEDEGPPEGLTLDQAIEQLVRANPDLLSKAGEIPKSRADAVTAGLRANPIVFFSADSIPYGTYSAQRPGNNGYGIVVVQPIDINHKRQYRVIVAEQAHAVLEAQYADAVRIAIDQLGTAFIDVLEARETLRYKQANVDRLGEMVKAMRELLSKSAGLRPDLDRTAILHDTAEIERDVALSNLTQARRTLGVLLALPEEAADTLLVRGTIRDTAPPPPPVEQLIALALCNRSDVVAYRRGVQRAAADIDLARRERFEDVFLFYTPYGFQNYAYQHDKSATSWSLGGLVSIPLFNRNQGNIARAQHGVIQAQVELAGVERRAAAEVKGATLDYETTFKTVRRLENEILPRARRMRDDQYQLFISGEKSITDYYNADRDYNDVVRQYYDSLIRHRRSMLRINMTVGQRLLP